MLESVIIDLTTAIRENTDAVNKLLLLNGSESLKSDEETPKKPAATKKPAAEKKKVEKAEDVAEETSSGRLEADYKQLQSQLIELSGVFSASHPGKPNAKDLGKKQAIAFMKEHTGCSRLDAVQPDQYQEFSEQLQKALGE